MMTRLASLLILLAAFSCAGMSQTIATTPNYSPADVLKVAHCILDNCAAWKLWKPYDEEAAQAVFSDRGKRYTLYAYVKLESTPTNETGGYLELWVRREGTTTSNKLYSFKISLGTSTLVFLGKNYPDNSETYSNEAMARTLGYIKAHPKVKASVRTPFTLHCPGYPEMKLYLPLKCEDIVGSTDQLHLEFYDAMGADGVSEKDTLDWLINPFDTGAAHVTGGSLDGHFQ